MSIDDAVKNAINTFLVERKYITQDVATEIAKEISTDVYQQFLVDINDVKKEIDKIRDRQDKMWDMVHNIPPTLWGRFCRVCKKLMFWRKKK